MLQGGLIDTDDLVGRIRWQRRFHIVVFFATIAGLVLFATCGMDAPNPDAPDPIEGSWMWLRYTFVLSTVISVITTEIYLLFSYRSFYFLHVLGQLWAITVLGWNAVSMLIIFVDCGSQYPQCALSKFTYTVRFITALSLLVLRAFAFWNASGLRNTVENIRRIRSVLIKQSKLPGTMGKTKDELAELYQQIRNEQILHVLVMVLTGVAWGFFAVSEMWIVFRNGPDDAWVTWIWWRNCLSLHALFPMAFTQVYFLLGGTVSRAFSRYSNFIWVFGVLPVQAVWMLYIHDHCNDYDAAVTLVHPECGTPNVLDDSVQAGFVWRICSFFALFAVSMANLVVFNSVTHSLLSLSIVKKRGYNKDDPEEVDKTSQISSRLGHAIGVGLSKRQENQALLKYMHYKVFQGPTASQMVNPTNMAGLYEEVKQNHPEMLLFSGEDRRK
jgi:hypothetical protein